MSIREKLSGNEAAAIALKQINPDVMAAFPITPSTEIPQYFSKYVADGSVDTEFVPVESEHSAMSACVGSQAAGARTVTATSSCGLALMFEELYIASSSRLPIILSVVNRALSGPININADHSDSMGARDSGWIQLYSEDNQEAYDNLIQAVKIGEHEDVQLPVMVCQDGFITSHAIENIELLESEAVKDFVGDYQAKEYLLNKDNPIAMGPYDSADYYMEHKYQQNRAMENAKAVIEKVAEEFQELSGRDYGFFETYKLEDADYAVVVLNSTAGTTKAAVDKM
ncbi:MAG: pyruvate ferredoxin oxidoreductase, partial [Halanaerobium sp.]